MSVTVIKATLKSGNFRQHKSNPKGNTLIFSRNHPTEKFVRIVVDSGIDKNTGKIVSQPSVSSVYININKHWREIVSAHKGTNLSGLITTVESKACSAAKCKHCGAKKFKAKSGKVVCANACWTNWSGKKKKAASTTKKSSQKITAGKPQKKSQKKSAGKKQRNYPLNKNPSQKKAQKFAAEILPGDLVTIQEIVSGKMTQDFTGSVLGIVREVADHGYVKVHWSANTTTVAEYMLPRSNCYYMSDALDYRFKVLSRPVEYAKVS